MHRIINPLLCTAALLLPAIGIAETAFVNVTVIPMTDNNSYSAYTVITDGDRITAIGPGKDVKVSADATIIDGTGKYLLPGITEMHGHLPRPEDSQEQAGNILFLYVANGVTTVRGMQGAAGQLEMREQIRNGELVGPRLYLAGPPLNDKSVNSAADAERIVREQKAEGWDALKIHEGLPLEAYKAMAKTANELGMRFGGHVPNDVGVFTALEYKQHTIDHMDNYLDDMEAIYAPITPAQIARAIEATRTAGTAIVPTQALWKIVYNQVDHDIVMAYPELQYMPQDVLDRWIERLKQFGDGVTIRRKGDSAIRVANRDILLKAFADAGIPILFGTDAPQIFSVPGFSIHREITALKNAGLSNYNILYAATAAPGNYFAEKDQFGTIQVGRRADMLLLDSNPLDDAARIKDLAGVMLAGRWLDKQSINTRLATILTANKISR